MPLEIAAWLRARTRGLLGRDWHRRSHPDHPSSSIHTLRLRFTIDAAYLDRQLRVTDVHTMKPNRIGTPRWRARHVLAAEAGALARWGIHTGVQLSIDH